MSLQPKQSRLDFTGKQQEILIQEMVSSEDGLTYTEDGPANLVDIESIKGICVYGSSLFFCDSDKLKMLTYAHSRSGTQVQV